MVDVEDDFDGEIRRKVTRKTFKIEEVSTVKIKFETVEFFLDELTRPI